MITGYRIGVELLDGGKVYTVSPFQALPGEALKPLQEAVGGWIEFVPCDDKINIIVGEESKLCDHVRNELATMFWEKFDVYGCVRSGDYVAGNAVIVGPTNRRSGKSTSAPAETLNQIRELVANWFMDGTPDGAVLILA